MNCTACYRLCNKRLRFHLYITQELISQPYLQSQIVEVRSISNFTRRISNSPVNEDTEVYSRSSSKANEAYCLDSDYEAHGKLSYKVSQSFVNNMRQVYNRVHIEEGLYHIARRPGLLCANSVNFIPNSSELYTKHVPFNSKTFTFGGFCGRTNTCHNRNQDCGHLSSERYVHTSSFLFDDQPSSQVEITVNALKERAENEKRSKLEAESKDKTTIVAQTDLKTTSTGAEVVAVVKPSIWVRIKDELLHYYHGFRLLFIDTKLSCKYCFRLLKGEKLSRREHRQLVRTTGDLFRLLPFSVFIIVPFMELLLPVALKLFPGMLPSTFETANEKEAKIKKHLKMKIEMAKFLQETLDSMALQGKGHHSRSAKEFVQFFEKVRKTGGEVTNEELLKFSKLFEDNITLDSLTRPQLTAICRLLEMKPFGTNNFLRFQLRMKLRSLAADDKLIEVEGVESLSSWELQQACRSRGMRAYGMTDNKLRQQLSQWLELSLQKKVPPSLLLLSMTLYIPDYVDPNATLAETIKQLPDEVKTRTSAAIGKREGKIDNRTRLEVIKTEEKKIEEDKKDLETERKLREQLAKKKLEEVGLGVVEVMSVAPTLAVEETERLVGTSVTSQALIEEAVKLTKATVTPSGELKEDAEELVDKALPVTDETLLGIEKVKSEPPTAEQVTEELSSEDIAEVEEALETIGAKQHRLLLEEHDLTDLKEEMQDYQEDIEDFKQVLAQYPESAKGLKESKAARRLFHRINKLIAQTELVIEALSDKTKQMQIAFQQGTPDKQQKASLVNLEELVTHLRHVADAPDSAKLAVIRNVLTAMDTDNDGSIELVHIIKALEFLSEEQVGVPPKLLEEVIQAIAKEEELEMKTVVQRAINVSQRLQPPPSTAGDLSVNDESESVVKQEGQ